MSVPVAVGQAESVIWGTVEEDVEDVETVGVAAAEQGLQEGGVPTDWVDDVA